MISKKEVQHIAKLARLGLTEKEMVKFQKELSPILDYVEKLKKVDVAKVEPTSHPLAVENVTRGDEENKKQSASWRTKNKKLLDLAPETKNGYIKVKSIIKLPSTEAKMKKRAKTLFA